MAYKLALSLSDLNSGAFSLSAAFASVFFASFGRLHRQRQGSGGDHSDERSGDSSLYLASFLMIELGLAPL